MFLPRLEGALHSALRWAGTGWRLSWLCLGLALLGTLFAAYPITSVVVPAVLLVPRRWRSIAVFSALGSSFGALALMIVSHHMGWASLYERFPELLSDPTWLRIIDWTDSYGLLALFLVAVSPLPQTPSLIVLSMAPMHYPGVFLAILGGKLLKYLGFAWVSSRFPGRIHDFLHRHGRAAP
ncbi:hypothetical protein [Pseudomonas panipatensis]|uniref:Membrane protein YqaA, SNARE-associated domain n=1 Tax=Pseudomonas panipatensis TaxID=428992 RepID=A0A1G8GTU3_9PSED|nr:hypothetical protein [Pseudomonas panipatensis]SDH97828.1 hypothetical protein SAMN05216272_104478 [Pseudomonas panipatensis]SMP41440.1 hypothetical protein SAMN06295951_101508 [Pseudomonas panipatensis]